MFIFAALQTKCHCSTYYNVHKSDISDVCEISNITRCIHRTMLLVPSLPMQNGFFDDEKIKPPQVMTSFVRSSCAIMNSLPKGIKRALITTAHKCNGHWEWIV